MMKDVERAYAYTRLQTAKIEVKATHRAAGLVISISTIETGYIKH